MSRIYDALLRAEKDKTQDAPAFGDDAALAESPSPNQARRTIDDSTTFRGTTSETLQGMENPQPTVEDHLPFIVREQPQYPITRPEIEADAATSLPSRTPDRTPPTPGGSRLQPAASVPNNELELAAWMSGNHGAPLEVEWHPDQKSLPALDARGALIEQIRVLRSRLHELRLDRSLKSIMVTSGLPQEGKSFVASNLAVGFAKFRNQRVLLIDGDMRRGRLHNVFGAPQQPGLTDYLANQASLSEVMQQMAAPGTGAFKSLASLTFIASGHDAENAADLSGNGRFQRLIEAVYDHFDWIIVDSSPVTLVADGVNLGRACDGVVMVVRAGITKYEVAQRAKQELKAAKLVGVVLNAIQSAPAVGYYGYDG